MVTVEWLRARARGLDKTARPLAGQRALAWVMMAVGGATSTKRKAGILVRGGSTSSSTCTQTKQPGRHKRARDSLGLPEPGQASGENGHDGAGALDLAARRPLTAGRSG